MKNLFSIKNNWLDQTLKVLPWPKGSFDIPLWQAHRGYWLGGETENTLGALIAAAAQNAPMVEFDVRITKDCIPILFHDESTKVQGRDVRVSDLTLAQLKDSVSFQVNTFEEVLLSDQIPQLLNIEIKSEIVLDEGVEAKLERKISEVIHKVESKFSRSVRSRVMFSAFNPFSLFKMSSLCPAVPRALLVWEEEKNPILKDMWWGRVGGIHALHLDHRMITAERMKIWSDLDLPVAAWTVNESHEMKRLFDLGITSVITDQIPDPMVFDSSFGL